MERITSAHLETALRVAAQSLGVPTIDKSVAWKDLPPYTLVIDAYNPGDGWRGRVECVDGSCPFGARRYSKRELYWQLSSIADAFYFKQRAERMIADGK